MGLVPEEDTLEDKSPAPGGAKQGSVCEVLTTPTGVEPIETSRNKEEDGNIVVTVELPSDTSDVSQESLTSPTEQPCEIVSTTNADEAMLESKGSLFLLVPVGRKARVQVSHVISPGQFWVQFRDQSSDLERVVQEIPAMFDESSETTTLEVGDACAAHFSGDTNWYRCRVESVNSDEVSLFFVDYGNRVVQEASAVRKLGPAWKNMPFRAVECRLKDVIPGDGSDSWSEYVCSQFCDMVTGEGKVLIAEFLSQDTKSGIADIRLLDMGLDVADKLVHESLAVISADSELSYPETSPSYEESEAFKNNLVFLSSNVSSLDISDIPNVSSICCSTSSTRQFDLDIPDPEKDDHVFLESSLIADDDRTEDRMKDVNNILEVSFIRAPGSIRENGHDDVISSNDLSKLEFKDTVCEVCGSGDAKTTDSLSDDTQIEINVVDELELNIKSYENCSAKPFEANFSAVSKDSNTKQGDLTVPSLKAGIDREDPCTGEESTLRDEGIQLLEGETGNLNRLEVRASYASVVSKNVLSSDSHTVQILGLDQCRFDTGTNEGFANIFCSQDVEFSDDVCADASKSEESDLCQEPNVQSMEEDCSILDGEPCSSSPLELTSSCEVPSCVNISSSEIIEVSDTQSRKSSSVLGDTSVCTSEEGYVALSPDSVHLSSSKLSGPSDEESSLEDRTYDSLSVSCDAKSTSEPNTESGSYHETSEDRLVENEVDPSLCTKDRYNSEVSMEIISSCEDSFETTDIFEKTGETADSTISSSDSDLNHSHYVVRPPLSGYLSTEDINLCESLNVCDEKNTDLLSSKPECESLNQDNVKSRRDSGNVGEPENSSSTDTERNTEDSEVSGSSKITVGEHSEPAVTPSSEATMGEISEKIVAEILEVIVAGISETTVANTPEASVAGYSLANCSEDTIVESLQVLPAESLEATMTEISETTVTESSETTAGSLQATVSESLQATVAESSQATVAESSQATVAESPQATVAGSLEATVAGSLEATVAESLEATVAESLEATVNNPVSLEATVDECSKVEIVDYSEVAIAKKSPESSHTDETSVGSTTKTSLN